VIPRDDKVFYPSRFDRWFGSVSLVVFAGMTIVLIFARVFQIPLFGA
jgi:hypothetical protein